MEFPIRKLLKYSESFEPLVWWKNLFGQAFSSIQPFLAPCEDRRGDVYPSPDNPSVQLTIRESGRRYRAFPPDELKDEVDDVLLDWEDVQAYRLSGTRLRASLRKVFNLKPAAGQRVENLCYIGRCECNKECRHVYACMATSDHGAMQAAENCTDPKKTGCVLFPAHHAKAADLLKSRGIASVALRECLSIKPDGFHGECPVNCAGCLLPPSPSLTEISRQIEEIKRERIEDLIKTHTQRQVIEEMAEGPEKFIAGLRAKLSGKEADLFTLLIHKESEEFGNHRVLSYAEIGERLEPSVTKQAVGAQYKKLKENLPEVWEFVESIRNPENETVFSGLSPSERRKEGIDESYNYDAA